MRSIAALLVVIGLSGAILVGTGETAVSSVGKLRLVATNPLTVSGAGFRAHERVKLTASTGADEIRTTRATATRTGTFRVTFVELTASRCDLVRVVAVGRAGTQAVVKRLPSPACMPERSPE